MAKNIPVSYASKRCNIVVFGVTGSGKSIVANKILRYDAFKAGPCTQSVSCEERVIEGPDNVMYSVKVVDTMGFSDPLRNRDDTVKDIQTFFQEKVVEGVSLVLFIVKKRRFSMEVIETIDFIKDNFKGISPISALVITHCEALTDKARAEFIEHLKSNKDPEIVKVCTFMQKGIYAVGFPDLSVFQECIWPILEQSMEADVKTLHQLIYQSTEMRPTSVMFYDEIFGGREKKFSNRNNPNLKAEQGNSADGCNVM